MRKVVVYELLSLDGTAEQPDAFITSIDQGMSDNLGRVIAAQDTVLLGRRTYEEWARFWPGSGIEPFATFINAVEKFVATSTPLDPPWAASSAPGTDFLAFVAELKGRPGGDIGVHGSIALAQSLLAAGLVDELRLVVAPALHPHGRRLFEHTPPAQLTLTRTATSPDGYLLLDYTVGH